MHTRLAAIRPEPTRSIGIIPSLSSPAIIAGCFVIILHALINDLFENILSFVS